MKNDTRADLHIHSTVSDGTWTPAEVVQNLKKTGIKLFALSDHENTQGIPVIMEELQDEVLSFIPAVEITGLIEKRTFHILGLGIDHTDTKLNELCVQNRYLLAERDEVIASHLEESGLPISSNEYIDYEYDRKRGGWKLLNYLIDRAVCDGSRSFFRLLGEYGPEFSFVNFAKAEEVIQAIKGAGGFPFLAHPGASSYGFPIPEILRLFLERGIAGIECYHPHNTAEITTDCLEFSKRHKLLVSGGSDCHGDFVPTRKLGQPELELSMLNLEGVKIIHYGR